MAQVAQSPGGSHTGRAEYTQFCCNSIINRRRNNIFTKKVRVIYKAPKLILRIARH